MAPLAATAVSAEAEAAAPPMLVGPSLARATAASAAAVAAAISYRTPVAVARAVLAQETGQLIPTEVLRRKRPEAVAASAPEAPSSSSKAAR